MDQEMEAVLQNQAQLQDGIGKIIINFKKDKQDRKTADYIKRRLENLELYWSDYTANHTKLVKSYPLQEIDYFRGDFYGETKKLYLHARELLEQSSVTGNKPTPAPVQPSQAEYGGPGQTSTKYSTQPGAISSKSSGQPSSQQTVELKSSGNKSKLDELLKKQLSNFKAFTRSVSNICVETMNEKWEFEDSLKTLQTRWMAIDALHWELDSELEGSNQQYEAKFTEHENTYIQIKKTINSKLWSVAHREKSTPQLDIPIFNGTFQQWIPFKDLFTEAIHNNPGLSNAQKLQFLKSKLKGEAERMIQHLQISSENYLTSWEILNHRYNNKKIIFTTHMNTMMNIPVMQQATSSHIKRIHDVTTECLNAIKNLGVNIDTWDPILVHLLVQKLDSETHSDYLESLSDPRELPSIGDFLSFMENKFTTMESARRKQEQQRPSTSAAAPNRYEKPPNNFKRYYSSNKATAQSSSSNIFKLKCVVCNSPEHGIYFCKEFLEFTPTQKRQFVTRNNLCCNCLFNHHGKPCTSTKRCRDCNGYHNTILHAAYSKNNNMTPNDSSTTHAQNKERSGASHVAQQQTTPEVLLTTALIKVQGLNGQYHTIRALIDQGSQVSLITERAAQLLGLKRRKCKGVITGVGTKDNTCTGMITISCSSLTENFTFDTDVYIMKSLTRNLPNHSFEKPSWEFSQEMKLADPDYNLSKPIDILLGAEVYSNIIQEGIYKVGNMTPVAQQTRLGWILCGKVQFLQCNVVLNNIDDIQSFWQIEDISENSSYSAEEIKCVELYKSTTTRLEDGKYQVRLPLKSNIHQLGQSKNKAVAQFLQMERKFNKDKYIEKEYKAFMHQYQDLGHMKPCTSGNHTMKPDYYLPHHCVVREESTTSAVRVVFNASGTTSTGISLNDCMYAGPNLQKDLLSLILGWRLYKVAFTADIEKMFRQIWVHEEDQVLQKIIWRDSPHESLREYQLRTISYGMKAASYLAMMTLQQLAEDERQNYPEAARVVENYFYMDDLLYGTHSSETALQLKHDLIKLMKSGGLNLRKWNSNYQELQDQQDQNTYAFKQAETTKTLGLIWDPNEDVFTFKSKIPESEQKRTTKRSLLSDISRLFDPLGWLTPLSTKLKLLFQRVWQTKCNWDDKLPDDICLEWENIKGDISNINKIKIPRWLNTDDTCKIELHGFCDSSQKAYACAIYSKIENQDENRPILVVGKSRLVPTNKEVSLPRLELSGALLLSKLMNKLLQVLSTNPDIKVEVYGWADSTAVLGWLQGSPDRWKPFVSTRVRNITEIMPPSCWRYVKSSENPADCASRGLTATKLAEHPLWFQGPAWLSKYDKNKQEKQELYTTKEEEKQVSVVTQGQSTTQCTLISELLNKYSSFTKVVRVLSRIRRVLSREKPKEEWLTLLEIREAKKMIIKHVQGQEFEDEIKGLKQGKGISPKSKILSLNPFLDKDEILRVGGRLRNAHISPEMINPILIPKDHRLTDLIINNAHELTYHGGARVTLAFTRQRYWIPSGNRTTKKYIQKCVSCKKHNPNRLQQIMGDLPEARVNPSRPFQHTGVDFTGHIMMKANKGRGMKTTKGYVAVFVCMITKAVHLELVGDMTTSSFIASLRRMSSKRGAPTDLYCDCGLNFVGASRILQEEYQELKQMLNQECVDAITDMEIKFHFNAPSWPSAGGLWESAVKSFKFHLKRVIGEQRLTYEELATIIAQIEACLNTRPLCPLSEDPEDFDYLTPSHFLSSGPVLTIIETEKDLRTRWHLTQKIYQDIWKRWRSEYLTQLTARSKNRQPKGNIKIDDVVLIHDDNLLPGKWIMGRVIELHPGKDGYVRVVTLKTKSGYLKRPVIKLSVLTEHDDVTYPNQSQEQNHTVNVNQEKERNEKKKPPTRNSTSPRSFFTTMIATFLLFMTVVSSVQSSYVNVTQFRDNQSLYFDKISDMSLIKDEWKLIVYYEMEPYWQGNRALNNYINKLDTACITLRDQAHCDSILIQLHHGFAELEHYNQVLMSHQFGQQAARKSARQRGTRGIVNGVGYLANTLFGVLDERFAEQYQKDISLLQTNQQHIVNLWRNQTSIVESENNLLKRTESIMNKQYKIMNQHMSTLEKTIHSMKNIVQTNQDSNDFAIGAILASNVLQNLKNLQTTLLETVTDINQGRFNVHLLTPEQLTSELSIISSKLPKDVSLPIDNIHSDLRQLYSLLKIKTRMLQEVLIFEITIPLISRESYEIFKIVPIPKIQHDEVISVIPISDFISMNLKRDTFIPMSEHDVRGCYAQKNNYYCHSQKPEYQMKSDKNLCETENQECKANIHICKNEWRDTHAINTYLFFCCTTCAIRSMCEYQVAAHQLTGAGIIHIGHGCIIKTDELTISPHKTHESEVRILPQVHSPTMSPINNLINITVPHLHIANESQQELEKEASVIENKINDLKSKQVLISDSVSNHDIHHYAMIYLLVGAAGMVGLIYMARRVQCGRKRAPTTRADGEGAQTRSPAAAAAAAAARQSRTTVARQESAHTVFEMLERRRENKSTSPVLKKFNDFISENSV